MHAPDQTAPSDGGPPTGEPSRCRKHVCLSTVQPTASTRCSSRAAAPHQNRIHPPTRRQSRRSPRRTPTLAPRVLRAQCAACGLRNAGGRHCRAAQRPPSDRRPARHHCPPSGRSHPTSARPPGEHRLGTQRLAQICHQFLRSEHRQRRRAAAANTRCSIDLPNGHAVPHHARNAGRGLSADQGAAPVSPKEPNIGQTD